MVAGPHVRPNPIMVADVLPSVFQSEGSLEARTRRPAGNPRSQACIFPIASFGRTVTTVTTGHELKIDPQLVCKI